MTRRAPARTLDRLRRCDDATVPRVVAVTDVGGADPPYRREMLERARALAARLRREDWVDLALVGIFAVVVVVDGFSHALGTAGQGATIAWGLARSRPWRCVVGSRWWSGWRSCPRRGAGRRHRDQRGIRRLLRLAGRRLHGRRPHAAAGPRSCPCSCWCRWSRTPTGARREPVRATRSFIVTLRPGSGPPGAWCGRGTSWCSGSRSSPRSCAAAGPRKRGRWPPSTASGSPATCTTSLRTASR